MYKCRKKLGYMAVCRFGDSIRHSTFRLLEVLEESYGISDMVLDTFHSLYECSLRFFANDAEIIFTCANWNSVREWF